MLQPIIVRLFYQLFYLPANFQTTYKCSYLIIKLRSQRELLCFQVHFKLMPVECISSSQTSEVVSAVNDEIILTVFRSYRVKCTL